MRLSSGFLTRWSWPALLLALWLPLGGAWVDVLAGCVGDGLAEHAMAGCDHGVAGAEAQADCGECEGGACCLIAPGLPSTFQAALFDATASVAPSQCEDSFRTRHPPLPDRPPARA